MARALPLLFVAFVPALVLAQVDYDAHSGRPWNQRADAGPDAEVPGWFLNLGVTGIRAQLVPDRPRHLLVRHVFEPSPAAGKVRAGDFITGVGADGEEFSEAHQDGYGMEVFGADGPTLEFAQALDAALADASPLQVQIERDGEALGVELDVTGFGGSYAETFPADCPKAARELDQLLRFLAASQGEDGSWGLPPRDTFAPLAMLASGAPDYLPFVERSVRFHASTTAPEDESWLINWRYMGAAIVMSEYYLATGEEWVLPELQEVYDFLLTSQYTNSNQVDPVSKKERPGDMPTEKRTALGGWGHNPGYEGYGPICMLTGQGAIALSLMEHCGIEVDRARLDAAFEFVERGTGRNGYVWYADEAASQDGWADMGRTSVAAIANAVSPYPDPHYAERAGRHAAVMGKHPKSFPDTHGSPLMGMGYGAAGAVFSEGAFQEIMEANRWWFVLSECADGTFYYQPNRDNAGYGADSRLSASAAVAFIYTVPRRALHITGRPLAEAPAARAVID